MKEGKFFLSGVWIKAVVFGISLVLMLQQGMMYSYADPPEWPHDTGIEAEAGIVVDADTGAVLYGQQIHSTHAPASITKLLTALVVIENCASLDDIVVFSHEAVYDVESGSGNALALEEGDQLTVRDCLYAMLLRSSNQAANALAEYVGGSREGFAAMMNAKIRQLGCSEEESNFVNPSGLNDENQYVSAYTMAKIGRAAFANETLMEIDSLTSYSIEHTINHPDGLRVNQEHKLLITTDEGSETYFPAAVAGKTGWTSIAGNTLVTCAKEGEKTLVSVVLKSQQTHYSDTIALMRFGFANFQNLDSTGAEATLFDAEGNITIGESVYTRDALEIQGSRLVTVPTGATLADAQMMLVTGEAMEAPYPDGALAEIRYLYNDRTVGSCYFVAKPEETEPETDAALADKAEGEDGQAGSQAPEESLEASGQPEDGTDGERTWNLGKTGFIVLGAAAGSALAAGGVVLARKRRKERIRLEEERREKRRKRLAEIGCTEEEFRKMVEERYHK